MKPKGYLVFHLNLAFSSIEEEAWLDVIQTCYHPLLDLVEKTGIPIGIELTGWTLKQIERVDISWVKKLKILLNTGKCELIGSGYCQIVGPLATYKVNEWNQRLGLDAYKKIVDYRPEIILVNEMAFSSGMVDLYKKFNYKGLIMDRDNIRLSLDSDNIPTHAKGAGNSEMPVLWSDSILFQKVQHFAHGDISINNYLDYLQNRIEDGESLFPIYCNDAEVFDYRPGRFTEERPTHIEGEWRRIEKLLKLISSNLGLEFISPSAALESNKVQDKLVSKLVSTAYPVPVKKQAKYNIARWAITGRNDLWLNTMCHRIEKQLILSKNNNYKEWQELCELWASDLRTHITNSKWAKAIDQLNSLLRRHKIDNAFGSNNEIAMRSHTLESVTGQYGDADIVLSEDGILLGVSTENISLELNLRRGLAIQSLAFSSHEMEPCIGTLPHGHFSCISLGADYYSGGVVVELPVQRIRFTDLEKVEPRFSLKDDGNIEISAEIKTPLGVIIKIIEVSVVSEKVSLSYAFPGWGEMIGSVRLGIITLLNQFSYENTELSLSNGGKYDEFFDFKGEFNHASPASSLVSSSRGLGVTAGKIKIINNERSFSLQWDPSECAVMPMLHRAIVKDEALSRVLFSMKETDDTTKLPSLIGKFSLDINAS
ncbi:hypothetical protein OAP13_00700 [Gammaproteobacteria bacterium]|nr:hypothetical protein [Gammaproteobacteria bacterium]MDC1251192.1 hypothetical protein [Gammaproteobacteria bacterium]